MELDSDDWPALAAYSRERQNWPSVSETVGHFLALLANVRFDVADLLGGDPATEHVVRFDGRVEHVPYPIDAFVAGAALLEHDRGPVTVRTVDPVSGEPVTFELAEAGVEATPPKAVCSYGTSGAVPDSVGPIGVSVSACSTGVLPGEHDAETLCDLVCEYVNAFESRASYERWVEAAGANTVPVSGEQLQLAARRFVASPLVDPNLDVE